MHRVYFKVLFREHCWYGISTTQLAISFTMCGELLTLARQVPFTSETTLLSWSPQQDMARYLLRALLARWPAWK